MLLSPSDQCVARQGHQLYKFPDMAVLLTRYKAIEIVLTTDGLDKLAPIHDYMRREQLPIPHISHFRDRLQ